MVLFGLFITIVEHLFTFYVNYTELKSLEEVTEDFQRAFNSVEVMWSPN